MLYNDFSAVAPTATPPVSGSSPPSCGDPHSVMTPLACDPVGAVTTGMAWLSYTLYRWVQVWWLLLVVAAAVALTVGAMLAVAIGRARRTPSAPATTAESTVVRRLPAQPTQSGMADSVTRVRPALPRARRAVHSPVPRHRDRAVHRGREDIRDDAA